MANRNPSPATRFRKGQVANPRGARAHDPIERELRRLTSREFLSIIETVLLASTTSLQRMIDDPTSSSVKIGVAKAFQRASDRGDFKAIDRIVSRIVGRPTTT